MTGLKVLKSVNSYVIKMTDATGFPGEMLQILPDVGLQQTKEQQKMMTQDVIRVQPDQKAVQVHLNALILALSNYLPLNVTTKSISNLIVVSNL